MLVNCYRQALSDMVEYSIAIKRKMMQIEARVENYNNPPPYQSLGELLQKLHKAERHHGILFIGTAKWKNREATTQPGWVHWHDGVFVNPLEGGFFFTEDLNIDESQARLLQPSESLHIVYYGESLPENN